MASVFQDEKWYPRKLAEITGKLWVLDHTFKIAGKIMDRKGAQAFAAACDVMNELKQFAAIAFVKDTRIASLRNLFAMLYERTDADAPEYISTDLCCLADKKILEFFGKAKVEADGGVGGITQTHLGGWHAVTRVTSKVTNKKNPLSANFSREFWRAAAQFKTEDVESLARCLELKEGLSKEAALDRAWKKPHGHAAHFYPESFIIMRRTVEVMSQFDGLTIEKYGPVIDLRTWAAWFELMTHVCGTRRRGFKCLSDPPDLLKNGRVFYVRRAADEARGKPQIIESAARDSHLEGLHRLLGHSWLPGTRYGEDLAYTLMLPKAVDHNDRMAVARGLRKDNGTSDVERLVLENRALYEEQADVVPQRFAT